MKKIYVAFDGCQFNSAYECLVYEEARNKNISESFRKTIRAYDANGEELEIPSLIGILPTDYDNQNAYQEINDTFPDESEECFAFAEEMTYVSCGDAGNLQKFKEQMKALGVLTGFDIDLPVEQIFYSHGVFYFNEETQKFEAITEQQYKTARTLSAVCDMIDEEFLPF